MGRTPYDAVAHLHSWVTEFRGFLDGKLRMVGLRPLDTMHSREAFDVIEAVATEASTLPLGKIREALRTPYWMTVESWGTDPTSVAAVEAMEAAMPLDDTDPEVAAYLERIRTQRAREDDPAVG